MEERVMEMVKSVYGLEGAVVELVCRGCVQKLLGCLRQPLQPEQELQFTLGASLYAMAVLQGLQGGEIQAGDLRIKDYSGEGLAEARGFLRGLLQDGFLFAGV